MVLRKTYRINVADSCSPRDERSSKQLELTIRGEENQVALKEDRVLAWIWLMELSLQIQFATSFQRRCIEEIPILNSQNNHVK